MNRAFLKSLILATVAASGIASASAPAAAPAKADAAKGASLYDAGATDRNVPACVSCHGAAGNSTIATNPKLAGQPEAYTLKQLNEFAGTSRVNPVMSPYAKALTEAERRDIAAYLATQAQKPGAAKNKDSLELGKKIYRAGIAAKGVPACASCHGPAGGGMPAQFPRIGGQHFDYTYGQLKAFFDDGRKNSVQMSTIAKRMSDAEMKAVADYVAGLK
jgi:cytochrome c553